jgi:predicted Fe-Mo cluster-binding NifX family protein
VNENNMKLIITATSPRIDSPVDPRFGRGAYFLITDTDTFEWQALPNPAVNASGGAGIQAAQFVSEQNCAAVISGDFGPNAYNALQAAGIQMYLLGSCRNVREAVQQFKADQLEQLIAPTEARGRGRRRVR